MGNHFKFQWSHCLISFLIVAFAHILWLRFTDHIWVERFLTWFGMVIYLAWLEAHPEYHNK